MSQPQRTGFEDFAAAKLREAATARIERLSTILHRRGKSPARGIGNVWTRAHYGGDFDVAVPAEERTALSFVFVQSKDGNTGVADPSTLGGGPTDKHLIYEGLSRVAADAVLAGAATVHPETFFSVWHPELVALRHALGLPRHPAQIVVSKHGRVNFDALLFNVPDVPVFLIAGQECVSRRAAWFDARPWVRPIPLIADNLRPAIDRLRDAEGIRRISAVGGRFTASRLVDAGLAQDLYLTTTSREGGEPGTPWYSGATPPGLEVLTKKQWFDDGELIGFEHLWITTQGAGKTIE
ncbi:MAG TPA: dihydrofolate reductase family protein [Vicinamibacterales bacterium]|nr:dihydrofolate reductase family protein [Vicinamibacterales bacterium]